MFACLTTTAHQALRTNEMQVYVTAQPHSLARYNDFELHAYPLSQEEREELEVGKGGAPPQLPKKLHDLILKGKTPGSKDKNTDFKPPWNKKSFGLEFPAVRTP